MNKFVHVAGISALLATLGGCATQPPMIAQDKIYTANNQKLDFGGSYDTEANKLTITVNGDSIMRGSFPPFTPTKSISAIYHGMSITADCYFGTVLSNQGGMVGMIAGVVQDHTGKSGDQCHITVDNKAAETLYF